jgi:hypothetical protein
MSNNETTYYTQPTYSYITINHDNAHVTQEPHFISFDCTSVHLSSNHFTSVHYTSFPVFHFTALLAGSSPCFQNSSLLLTYCYFPNPFSKTMCFIGESC